MLGEEVSLGRASTGRCSLPLLQPPRIPLGTLPSEGSRGSATRWKDRVWTTSDAVPPPFLPPPSSVLLRRPPPRWRRRGRRLPAAPLFGIGQCSRRQRSGHRKCCGLSLSGAAVAEVGALPRKSSPYPPPAANMAVDSAMELLFLDTFKHPSAEVRLPDLIPILLADSWTLTKSH